MGARLTSYLPACELTPNNVPPRKRATHPASRNSLLCRWNPQYLIGLRQIERFSHHGLVNRLGLPPSVQLEREPTARGEVMRIVEMLDRDVQGIQIGIVNDNMPNETFQIFSDQDEAYVATSPCRLSGMRNIRTGIVTITTASDAVTMYRKMIDLLWIDAAKTK